MFEAVQINSEHSIPVSFDVVSNTLGLLGTNGQFLGATRDVMGQAGGTQRGTKSCKIELSFRIHQKHQK